MDVVTRSICVSSRVLNGSCKAASPRCDPTRGQGRKQKSGVDDELHLGPKCGSLATSPSASSAGDVCDSLATSDSLRSARSSSGVSGRGAELRLSASALQGEARKCREVSFTDLLIVACLHLNVTLSHECCPRRHEPCMLS